MKKRSSTRGSRKIALLTLCTTILLCVVLVIALAFSFFRYRSGVALSPAAAALSAQINAANSETLTLSLIGVAVAVWIGLNIYNALARDELENLLQQAEAAQKITENLYTQILLSKLRLLSTERAENFLAAKLLELELLPLHILEKMLELEDTLLFSYKMYGDGGCTVRNDLGLQLANAFEVKVKNSKAQNQLDAKQYSFLIAYIALRKGDLSYYLAQAKHASSQSPGNDAVYNELVDTAIRQYIIAVKNFFEIDISKCSTPQHVCHNLYTPEEAQGLAILANNICSTYMVLKPKLSNDDIKIARAAGEIAVYYSSSVSPRVQAIMLRNLGVSYEKRANIFPDQQTKDDESSTLSDQPIKDMDRAFELYCKSYQCNPQNPKTAYCLGAWYCKKAKAIASKDVAASDLALWTTDTANKLEAAGTLAKVIDYLEQSAYWYELKVLSTQGQPERWLETVYIALHTLTGQTLYKEKAEKLRTAAKYHNAVTSMPVEPLN